MNQHSVRSLSPWTCALALTCLAACDEASEAPRRQIPVYVDGSQVTPVTTDLGYTVTPTAVQMGLTNFEFTVGGEAHMASLSERLWRWAIPAAVAHPGHVQLGEVAGELAGTWSFDVAAPPSAPLGVGTFVAGRYEGANVGLAIATVETGAASVWPVTGHAAWIAADVARGEERWPLTVLFDVPEGRVVTGGFFGVEISQTSPTAVAFRWSTADELEGDTFFDTLDFAALAPAGSPIALSADSPAGPMLEAYQQLWRTYMTHDHLRFVAFEPNP